MSLKPNKKIVSNFPLPDTGLEAWIPKIAYGPKTAHEMLLESLQDTDSFWGITRSFSHDVIISDTAYNYLVKHIA